MIEHGTAFAQVEDAIDAAEFSEDHKAALWLLAWSLRDSALQRHDARLMAESFSADVEYRLVRPDSARSQGVLSLVGPDAR
jgi:hypothetical protein